MLFLILFGIAEVEHLHLDAGGKSTLSGLEFLDALRHGP